MYPRGLNKYRNSITNTLNSKELVVFVYDKIISLIEQSKNSITQNKSPERFVCLKNAKDIVEGMFIILDDQANKDLARILRGFYFKLHNDISYLQCTKNLELYDSVIKELKIIQSEWNS